MIGITANAVYGLLVITFNGFPALSWLLLVPTTLIAGVALAELNHVRQFGVRRMVRSSAYTFTLRRQLIDAKRSLDFMGVSARSVVSADAEMIIKQKLLTTSEFRIRFLLFDRQQIDKLQRRAAEETGDVATVLEWSEVMASTIHTMLRIRAALGSAGERLEVRTYTAFPVFRFINVDGRVIILNYYERGEFPSKLDHIELTLGDKPGLGRAFQKYFAECWAEATPV